MKEQNECEIVQDLLINYVDGIVSETSRQFIENHVNNCQECKDKLQNTQNNIEKDNEIQKEQVDYLHGIRKKLKKKSILIIVTSVLLVVIVLFNIAVFDNYNKIASNLEIHLDQNITEEQMNNIKNTILDKYSDINIVYFSQEDALEIMKAKFGKDKEYLLDGMNEVFYAFYKIEAKPATLSVIRELIKNHAGIKAISTNIDDNPYVMFFARDFYNSIDGIS